MGLEENLEEVAINTGTPVHLLLLTAWLLPERNVAARSLINKLFRKCSGHSFASALSKRSRDLIVTSGVGGFREGPATAARAGPVSQPIDLIHFQTQLTHS